MKMKYRSVYFKICSACFYHINQHLRCNTVHVFDEKSVKYISNK
jgi:hypothetical protein